MRLLRLAAVLAVLPALAACSGSGAATDDPTDGPGTDPVVVQTYPAYETFDAAGYTATPPEQRAVAHDVPPRTMQGTVTVPGSASGPTAEQQPREVDGFRIQVGRSEDRQTAERIRSAVVSWWEDAQSQAGAPERLEVVVAYVQPHYRVRVGAFEFQNEADAALTFVRREYPDSFIVPDRVTVR
ncbi:MAG: SPOR domain-containing protein [Bacteroidota bacterium]